MQSNRPFIDERHDSAICIRSPESHEGIPRARILYLTSWTYKNDRQYLLDLWLGDNTPEIDSCSLMWEDDPAPSSGTIWTCEGSPKETEFPETKPGDLFRPVPIGVRKNLSDSSGTLRNFGWHQISKADVNSITSSDITHTANRGPANAVDDVRPEMRQARTKERRYRIGYYVVTGTSLIYCCCQDVFSAIFTELVRLQETGKVSLNIHKIVPGLSSSSID